MTYNDEQFKTLAEFESAFRSAIRSNYVRPNPGRSALATITLIHQTATGQRLPQSFSCSSCVLEILRTVGAAWIKDFDERSAAMLELQRRIQEENEASCVSTTPAEIPAVEKSHETGEKPATEPAAEAKPAKTGKPSPAKKSSRTTKKSAK